MISSETMGGVKLEVNLTGVQKTLLIPLAGRVQEALREDGEYDDPRAVDISERLDVDLEPITRDWKTMATIVGRTKILDEQVGHFMARQSGAQVVNIGCGLCTRFWRIDDGKVRWIDLDVPEVIELKSKLMDQTDRYTLLAADALTEEWLDAIEADRPVLFVVEGLVMYLSAEQVKGLLTMLGERFTHSEALIEVMSPLLLHVLGRRSRAALLPDVSLDFGISRASELETLVPGLEAIDQWLHADVHPEQWRWLRFFFPWFPPIHACMKILRVRLGVR